jgi:AcrR family transcriptional regulator
MPRPRATSEGETPVRDPRREILAAASALLYEGGPAGLTIRRLALRCGYTAPAIYAEFGDKAGLLDAVLRDAIDKLTQRVQELPKQTDLREQMLQQFKEVVRFGLEHPTHYRLMEAMTLEQVLPIPNALETRQQLEAPVEGVARELGSIDVETFRQAFWALLHGLISLPASRPDVDWRPELAEVAFEALLAGLLHREGSGGR